VKAETILEAGEPYELTCNAVQKNNINLLVIGNTSINGTLKRLGNLFVTSKIISTALKSRINCMNLIQNELFQELEHAGMVVNPINSCNKLHQKH
jgi:hypothetical protein